MYLGASKEMPWGVITAIVLAALFSLAGWAALRPYSIEK